MTTQKNSVSISSDGSTVTVKSGVSGRTLLIILLVAAAARTSMAFVLEGQPTFPDGVRYQTIAEHVVTHKEYPTYGTYGGPLHPLVLASLYSVLGFSMTAARVLTAVLGTITCGAVYCIGAGLFSRRAGLVAAGLLAVYPLYIFLSALFEYPETLFTLLVALSLLLLIRSSRVSRAWVYWGISGIVLGLASLSIPTSITFVPVLLIWAAVDSSAKSLGRLSKMLAFGLGVSCVVLGWAVHWQSRTGWFMVGSGNGGEALFKGNCELTWLTGEPDIEDVYGTTPPPPEHRNAWAKYKKVMDASRVFPSGPERNRVFYKAVQDWYVTHPAQAFSLLGQKIALYWAPVAKLVCKHSADNTIMRVVQKATFVPILLLAIVGAVASRRHWRDLMPLYLFIGSQWATYSLFSVSVRYRSHIDPMLIVLAAYAVSRVIGRKAGRLMKRPGDELVGSPCTVSC